jgi:hypothetical protein
MVVVGLRCVETLREPWSVRECVDYQGWGLGWCRDHSHRHKILRNLTRWFYEGHGELAAWHTRT